MKMVPMYCGDSKKWNCSHINNADLIVLNPMSKQVFVYNSDFPEPEHEYYYLFFDDLRDFDYWLPKRYEPCDCQPERSKREDSQECEMRCSEHCGDTVRDK